MLQPVDDLFKRDKLIGADFWPPIWEMMGLKGKVWLVPLTVDANFPFFWNKAVLREAGVNPDRAPATVAELDQAVERLNREVDGKLTRVGFVPWDWYSPRNSILTAGLMFGGSFYDKATDRLTFNHPNVVRALEWIAGWAQRLRRDRVNELFTGVDVPARIATGKVAFHPLVAAAVATVKRLNPDTQLGYGPLPGSPPGQAGVVWAGAWSVGTPPGSQRREDAWEFMRWIGASAEGTLLVAQRMGGLPGYVKSPGLDHLAKDPDQVAHVDAVKRIKYLRPEVYAPVTIDYAPLDDALDGKRSARAVLDEITEQSQRKLALYRAQEAK